MGVPGSLREFVGVCGSAWEFEQVCGSAWQFELVCGRSSLTCPHCLKQSNTFDPFLCISLPIPLRQTRALNVTLVFSNKSQRFVRVGLAVPLLGSVQTLRGLLAQEGNINTEQVILVELYSDGFQRSFSDDDDMTSISESDVIFAFQAPAPIPKSSSSRYSGNSSSVITVMHRD
ncbi:hypothetical protein NFI96_008770 [Prochilodus magdalenae]|nr:hypothetical protein NFI96_008770 [Prochilodus magdalenae]